MKDLREYMNDAAIEIKELWFDFGNQENSKIRILFNYLYSKKIHVRSIMWRVADLIDGRCQRLSEYLKVFESASRSIRFFKFQKRQRRLDWNVL